MVPHRPFLPPSIAVSCSGLQALGLPRWSVSVSARVGEARGSRVENSAVRHKLGGDLLGVEAIRAQAPLTAMAFEQEPRGTRAKSADARLAIFTSKHGSWVRDRP